MQLNTNESELCKMNTVPCSQYNYNLCYCSFSSRHKRIPCITRCYWYFQKPYVCSVTGCKKRYTDPSSLRKHVKNHSAKEQALAKRKVSRCLVFINKK